MLGKADLSTYAVEAMDVKKSDAEEWKKISFFPF